MSKVLLLKVILNSCSINYLIRELETSITVGQTLMKGI